MSAKPIARLQVEELQPRINPGMVSYYPMTGMVSFFASYLETNSVNVSTGSGTVIISDSGASISYDPSQSSYFSQSGSTVTFTGSYSSVRISTFDGSDTINASGYSSSALLTLDAGAVFSSMDNDTVIGSTGGDSILGGNGLDVLMGGTGNDVIAGGSGADTLNGDDGDDVLQESSGTLPGDGDGTVDRVFGGNGQDTFYVELTDITDANAVDTQINV